MKQYKEFDDWFLEIENYGTRAERFYESLDSFQSDLGRTANGVMWLKAAFDSARLEKEAPTPCACMGPQGDDPYCPCTMKEKGLKSSAEWTEDDRARLNKALIEVFAQNKGKKHGSN